MPVFLQLAPMQALTDVFFMNTYHRMFGGFDEMMAPYIMASSNSPIKSGTLQKNFGTIDSGIKLIPQLLSNDAPAFLHYDQVFCDLGFDKMNWNLGCPYPFVTKKLRGSGLLSYPDKIDNILEQIMPKLNLRLSIKVRSGYSDEHELYKLTEVFNRYPVDELIIHPRTASQLYEGEANRVLFGEIYREFKMPVVYNGDIVSSHEVVQMQKDYPGIKGFMIGRGAFINPFITMQINGVELTHDKKLKKYREFYFELHHHYKQKKQSFLGHMKELWSFFSQSFQNGSSYLFALRTINEVEVFEHTVERIFESGKLII